jgi:hypothetical protein
MLSLISDSSNALLKVDALLHLPATRLDELLVVEAGCWFLLAEAAGARRCVRQPHLPTNEEERKLETTSRSRSRPVSLQFPLRWSTHYVKN